MRVDLPLCNLKTCRYSFDGNCISKTMYEQCEYTLAKEERPHGEWIPCFERLPEESLNSVIGWDMFRERCVFVQYMDGHFQINGKQESFDIIAWMPLPEPYKKEGEKRND